MENPPFVKKFDFRGIYGKDIFDRDAFYVGLALLEVLKPKKILLGWDTRPSSKQLAMSMIEALKDKGVEICYLDKVPIDYVTAASNACDFDLSVMFTGSHNTWEWTGMLVHIKGGRSLQGELVTKVVEKYKELESTITHKVSDAKLAEFNNFESEIEKIYSEKIASLIPLSEITSQKVIVDIGDGSGFKSLALLERLLPQVTFERICDRQLYNQDSKHTADPSEIKNMEHILSEMKDKDFSAGFVFDSDGDRVLAVDPDLNRLNGSVLASALIQCFSMLSLPDKKVGYAVECGPSFYNTVIDLNKTNKNVIEMQPIPVGRSIVRGMVFDSKIDFGFENVGHFYVKDFFMTDSAIFVLACVLYWSSMNGSLSKLIRLHPDGSRFQASVKLSDETDSHNAQIEAEVIQKYENSDIQKITVDGVRLEILKDGYMSAWIAFRKSGYEAIEKYYSGALDLSEASYLREVIGIKE